MPSVVALSCPICGAPLSTGVDNCGFCGSLIVIKSDHPKINPHNLKKSVIDEHIADFRRSLRLDQYDESAHYGLGVAYFNLGLGEYSADELTHAARLMPENPNIQAQLAVVLRDLVLNGETSYKKSLSNAISNTLKLDPNNLDGLSLKAEALSHEGQHSAANIVAGQVEKLDARKGRQTRESMLGARIATLTGTHTWSALAPLLDEMGKLNPTRAVKMLQEHLSRFNYAYPLQLVDAEKYNSWEKHKRSIKTALSILAFFLLLPTSQLFDSENGAAAFLGLTIIFGIPVVAYYVIKHTMVERAMADAITVDDEFIYSNPPDSRYLQRAANATNRYIAGEFIDV